jgi:hypothetical protein
LDGPFVLSSAPFTPVASWEGDIPCSPVLAPLFEVWPIASIAGPLFPPGSPLTPGPELCGELGWLSVEVSAAIAGAAPISAATAQAAMSFFMAYPSFGFYALLG